MLEGETVLYFWFHRVCKAVGRVSELLPFTDPFALFLTPRRPYCEFRCERTLGLWQKEGSFICPVCGHACTYTEHMLALSLWKGPMFYTELKCVAFIVPTPSSVLVLHFSRRTQSRTLRHDTWVHVGMDTPLPACSHLIFSGGDFLHWLKANSLFGLCAWSIP